MAGSTPRSDRGVRRKRRARTRRMLALKAWQSRAASSGVVRMGGRISYSRRTFLAVKIISQPKKIVLLGRLRVRPRFVSGHERAPAAFARRGIKPIG